jgi:hypothetical protein
LEAKLTKPRGQEEERDEAKQMRQRAAADLAGAGQGAHRRLGSPGERLGLEPTERGQSEGGGWAGPSRFGQTHLGGLTGGPRLSASLFNSIKFKNPIENPNMLKNNPEKYLEYTKNSKWLFLALFVFWNPLSE